MRTFSVILLVCLCAFASARSSLRQKRSDDTEKPDVDQKKGNILDHIKEVNGQFLATLSSLGADLPKSYDGIEGYEFPKDYADKVKAAAKFLDRFVKLDEKIVEDAGKNIGDLSEAVRKEIQSHTEKEGCLPKQITDVVIKEGACAGLYVAGPCLFKAVGVILFVANIDEKNLAELEKLKIIKFIVTEVKNEEEGFKELARNCNPVFDHKEDAKTRVLRKLEELLLSREST